MKPFNLARAKAGDPVIMQNGTPCRIICFDKLGAYPIIAIYERFDGEERCTTYTLSGICSGLSMGTGADLKMASKTKIVNGIEIDAEEHYAGIILDEETGLPSYHLILLPRASKPLEWQQAMDWAKGQGGDLPTRREQSLLIANLKKQFLPVRYWSREQQSSRSAWALRADTGHQSYILASDLIRARAVRCVLIGE